VNDDARSLGLGASRDALVVLAIQLVCLGLLAYWALILIRPFLTILIWSVVIAVALYPLFDWLSTRLHGRRVLAAVTITLASLVVMLGPATWLGISLANSLTDFSTRIFDGAIAVPPPPESIQAWPLIGKKAFETWQLASTNLQELLLEFAPQLKPLGGMLLNAAGSIGINVLKFVAGIVLSGFLFIPGPALVQSVKNILAHLAAKRAEAFVDLAGATIRNISRGVIGVAILQALLAGIGLMFAAVPAAGLISLLVLILGIVQIGPSILIIPLVIWSWFTMDTAVALVFSLYMLSVNFIDNILRPLVIAKGLSTPMPIILIGVFGGTIAHGLIGLFVGPIVLSIAWQLIVLWTRKESIEELETAPAVKAN
jgi:predicted PurR-regulated permease PerM